MWVPAGNSITKEITLKDDQQTYQKHKNGDFIDGMHSPYVETVRA